MKRIIVSVTNDLTIDQRVAKVCKTLEKLGYDILLIGRELPNSIPVKRTYKTKRIRLLFNKSFLFYAEYNIRLFFILLFSKKNILLANDLDTLLPNFLVSKLHRKKLVYDSHELFTEVPELVHRPFVKKIWLSIEKLIVPKLKNTYTVCDSIANFYNKKYKTNFKVIRNTPITRNTTTTSLPFSTEGKKIILYQGAINVGRGISLLIDTMEYLNQHIFVIIGDGDILHEMKEKVIEKKLGDKIHFLGKIKPSELQQLTPLADIGISLEEDLGLNYRFALPNKIFDYIHAEIPVLVSDLPEMKQVVENYNIGEIVTRRAPKLLAKQIQKFSFKKYSNETLRAKKIFNWENEEKKLILIYKNAK